jgi:hypothetical protein
MSDFTTLQLQVNTGTNAVPVWTAVPAAGSGTGQELRWSDVSTAGAIASASWPFMTRPGSTAAVPYLYVFSADTTSLGALGTSSNTPAAFTNANYLQARINFDGVGTFASAPILTAYASTAHGAVTRGDNSMLGGNTTDTGATARSYLKGNMFGRVVTAGAPAAAPTNAPVVTDGATGALTPTAGANWLTNYQGLQGDNDYLQFPATPAATTADNINIMLALFTGPNMSTGTYANDASIKYTFA